MTKVGIDIKTLRGLNELKRKIENQNPRRWLFKR